MVLCGWKRLLHSRTTLSITKIVHSVRCYPTVFRFHGGINPVRTVTSTRFYSSTLADPKERRKLWLLIIPVTTFSLGTWQIFRLQWKAGLIEELEKKTQMNAIDMPDDILDRLDELEYRRVRLHGHFDHSHELYMWPRSPNQETTNQRTSVPGAYVITPFFCKELGQMVLVNRGWVPKRKMDPETRAAGQVEGEITLTAVVRTQEKRAPFAPENEPAKNHWSYRDVEAMSQYAQTSPVFVDADASTTVQGGPVGGQTKVTLRNEHLQYIFTWYALSLATFYMFYKLWTGYKRRR